MVALETPHSPKGLHLLARHSQSFASAVLLFISKATTPSTNPHSTAAAAAAFVTSSQRRHSVTQTDNNRLKSRADEQTSAQRFDRQSLHASLKAMRQLHQAELQQSHAIYQGPACDSSYVAPVRGVIREVIQQDCLMPHRVKATAAAGVAAAVATAHRCLESMLARDNIFTLPPSQIVQTLFSPAQVLASAIGVIPIDPISGGPATLTSEALHMWSLREGAGVYMGCCSLVMAGLRHHAAAVRRCMALVGASTRALLKALMLWSQPQTSTR